MVIEGEHSDGGGVAHVQPFRKLCKALKEFPNDRVIDSVKFHHFEMRTDSNTTSMVESAIKNKRIVSLDFERCFGCTPLVSKFLESNESCENLSVDCGVLSGSTSAQRFANAVRDHSTLEKVDLINCEWNGNDDKFTMTMEAQKDKTELKFKKDWHMYEGETMKEVHLIPSILATNPKLQRLELEGAEMIVSTWNRSRDDPPVDRFEIIRNFANALSTNTNLKELIFHKNDMNKEAEQILLKAIYDDTSLNSIASSNHTCQVAINEGKVWSGSERAYKLVIRKINAEYEWVQGDDGQGGIARKSKLLHAAGAFNEEGIVVQHFLDLPLELVPKLLEFAQYVRFLEHYDTVTQLAFKNVYELMKNIVAPLLPTPGKQLKRKREDTA